MTDEIQKPTNPLKRWGPLGVIIALLIGAYSAGLQDYISLSSLIMHRQDLGVFVSENVFVAALSFVALFAALVAFIFSTLASICSLVSGLRAMSTLLHNINYYRINLT